MSIERLISSTEAEVHFSQRRKDKDYRTKIELLRKIASLHTYIEWLETDKAEVVQRLYKCIDTLRDANHSKFCLLF